MINLIFKPSKSKVLKDAVLRRSEDLIWTTGNYWLMLTTLEPKYISELKAETIESSKIEKMIEKVVNSDNLEEVKITNDLKVYGRNLSVNLKSENQSIWVNPYYLSMFINVRYSVKFYASDRDMLVVKRGDLLVGIIMGMRIEGR